MTADRLLKRLFTVEEYYKMAEAGILTEANRVELIDGEIVGMTPIGSRHAACVDRLTRLFVSRLGPRSIVRVQNPVRLGEYSEPQPDVTLLKPRPDFYAEAHPTPQNVLLLVEVADTSTEYDRGVKLPLYARAGILEVWLVLLSDERVEIYRQPSPQGYGEVRRVGRGASLASVELPELVVAVDEVLG